MVLSFILFCSDGNAQRYLSFSAGIKAMNSTTSIRWYYNSPISEMQLDRSLKCTHFYAPLKLFYEIDSLTFIGLEYSFGKFKLKEEKGFNSSFENNRHGLGFFGESRQMISPSDFVYFNLGIRYSITRIMSFDRFYLAYESPYKLSSKWNGLGGEMSMGILSNIPNSGFSIKYGLGVLYERPKLTELRVGNDGSTLGDINSRLSTWGIYVGVDVVYHFQEK